MISSSSLAAFSAATTTSPVDRPQQARLVRQPPVPPTDRNVAPASTVIKDRPSTPPPRGSLLNISV